MSSFFAILQRNQTEIDSAISKALLRSISTWSPDRTGLWSDTQVSLGHAMLCTTPESQDELLPSAEGDLAITSDARLDNRFELLQELGLSHEADDTYTDSQLILEAYRRWGEAAPNYLVGDFAFVIWDTLEGKLFCARDQLGIRQLYYHLSDDLIVISNEINCILSHPSFPRRLNQNSVAGFMVHGEVRDPEATFFETLVSLPPAHTLTCHADNLIRKCYWRLEDTRELTLQDTDVCAQQLRHLLERSVTDRLRSSYAISSHLSGGLDSSTIAVIAARALSKENKRLIAFNWNSKPEDSEDPSSAEWVDSQSVADAENIDLQGVSITAEEILEQLKDRDIAHGDSDLFFYERKALSIASESGSRTLLSGWGGDEFATYHGLSCYAELAKKGRLIACAKSLWLLSRDSSKPIRSLCSNIYHRIVLVFAPRALYPFFPRSRVTQFSGIEFATSELSRLVELETSKQPELTMQAPGSVRSHMLAYLKNGHLQSRISSWAACGRKSKVEYAYPLLDRRLVEFVFSLPADQFIGQGKDRYIFRMATEGLLPEKIRWEEIKAEPMRVRQFYNEVCRAAQNVAKGNVVAGRFSSYIDSDRLTSSARDTEELPLSLKSSLFVKDFLFSLCILFSDEIGRSE